MSPFKAEAKKSLSRSFSRKDNTAEEFVARLVYLVVAQSVCCFLIDLNNSINECVSGFWFTRKLGNKNTSI